MDGRDKDGETKWNPQVTKDDIVVISLLLCFLLFAQSSVLGFRNYFRTKIPEEITRVVIRGESAFLFLESQRCVASN